MIIEDIPYFIEIVITTLFLTFGYLIILIPVLTFFYNSSISAIGQIKNGGPALFLLKSLIIKDANKYVWFQKDVLLWKSIYNIDVEEIRLGNHRCQQIDKEIISISPPFIRLYDRAPYRDLIGDNCIPKYFDNNSIGFYGIKFKKDSKTEECINLYETKKCLQI